MPRDSFFKTHEAEMSAHIAMATLRDLGGDYWRWLDCDCTGEVHGVSRFGVHYSFRWDPVSQRLDLTHRWDPTERVIVMELAA